MNELSEKEFRRMLEAKGLNLDDKAFAAALQGAQHLRAEIALVARYLEQDSDKHA